ncbi:MAG: hypothetical protein HQ562_06970 [Candidatus Marinimicrobia bacterium]|nr:hypothetical protein [Candidatus Neomarinimicrobiota bacterium]
MFTDPNGPIEEFSRGIFIINGKEHSKSPGMKLGAGKDIRLIGSAVSAWKERKGHQLTTEMITGVFGKNIDILIIGIGVNGALECPLSVQEYIRSKGIQKIILERTPDACRTYNKMNRAGLRIALLAHGTC